MTDTTDYAALVERLRAWEPHDGSLIGKAAAAIIALMGERDEAQKLAKARGLTIGWYQHGFAAANARIAELEAALRFYADPHENQNEGP